MTQLNEGRHPAAFVIAESEHNLSRDNIVIASGAGVLVPGTVIGFLTATGSAVATPKAGNVGNGAFTIDPSTPTLTGAENGTYTVIATSAGASAVFQVKDPGGHVEGNYTTGAAAFATEIKFTIADGGTHFAIGDEFDVVVNTGAVKAVPAVVDASDGSQTAAGIILYGVDATSADVAVSAITRNAEVNGHILTYAAGVATAGEQALKIAQLAKVGIIVRL